jgi:hypothetical protein
MVLLEPLERFDHPVIAIACDGRALACAESFQIAPRDPEPLDPAAAP